MGEFLEWTSLGDLDALYSWLIVELAGLSTLPF
jgi:hypothetical protein